MNKSISFDEVFKIWLDAEVISIEGRDILQVAKAKGFTSIAEWRLSTALRLGMDKKSWHLETIENPNEVLPNILVGPYQGWSKQNGIKFFDNKLSTTFTQALEIPEFFDWISKHDRIIPMLQNFPSPTSIILFRKENGELIHIEGGHRIATVAYAKKIGKPLDLNDDSITAAVAVISASEIEAMVEVMHRGTDK